jgi:hypothetical protein
MYIFGGYNGTSYLNDLWEYNFTNGVWTQKTSGATIRGNHSAVNQREQAYGIAQIRQIRLLDYEMHTGIKYELTDMLDSSLSREVFMFYAEKNLPDGIEEIVRNWNGGSHGVELASTEKYYEKVVNTLNQLL